MDDKFVKVKHVQNMCKDVLNKDAIKVQTLDEGYDGYHNQFALQVKEAITFSQISKD